MSLKRALDELGETFNVGTSQPLDYVFRRSAWNGTCPGSTSASTWSVAVILRKSACAVA